jgi:hypothetical protein
MISALSASATGGVDQNVIVAAVVLWRLFYGLLAFFPGALTLTRFSKQNAELLKGASSDFSDSSRSQAPGQANNPIDPPDKNLEKDSR